MNGWYDIAVLDGNAETLRQNEDEIGINKSKDFLHTMIQEEISAGIPSDRIVLGGFSQGGAMSIFSGLTAPVRLGGIVALSSYLLLSRKFKDIIPKGTAMVNQQTPIFMAHGTSDQVVNPHLGEMSRDILKEMSFNVNWKSYANMGHEACPEEIDDIQKFLEKSLPSLKKTEL